MKHFLFISAIITGITLISCSNTGTGDETQMYRVNVSITPLGAGSISPSANDTYEEGKQITLRADPTDAYIFSNWSGDIDAPENPLLLTINQNYSLTANFEKKNYKLTTNTEGEGSVSEQIIHEKSKDYEHGIIVELTAIPVEGWEFGEWQGDITSTENPTQITMDQPKEVTAVFKKLSSSLFAMGYNEFGQLGDGTTSYGRSTLVQITSNAKNVAAGAQHSLFIKTDGALWAMGSNSWGQLGDGSYGQESDSSGINRVTPIQITSNVKSVQAGTSHSLFVKNDGTLWAMGWNSCGQLGDGTRKFRDMPVKIASDVKSISGGGCHSLFIKTDATLWGMGGNKDGQLGDGTKTDHPDPIQIATDVKGAAAGNRHSLFVKTDGTLWAMGWNNYGQLGDGTRISRDIPVQIASNVKSVNTNYNHSLFIKTDGTLWGMGWNFDSQLGNGTNHDVPVKIASGVKSTSAGNRHTLFIKIDNTLWGMGSNSSGQLGNRSETTYVTPIQIASYVAKSATGGGFSLFIYN